MEETFDAEVAYGALHPFPPLRRSAWENVRHAQPVHTLPLYLDGFHGYRLIHISYRREGALLTFEDTDRPGTLTYLPFMHIAIRGEQPRTVSTIHDHTRAFSAQAEHARWPVRTILGNLMGTLPRFPERVDA